jgi:hypothetical protein
MSRLRRFEHVNDVRPGKERGMESLLAIEYAALTISDLDMNDVRLGQLAVLAIALSGILFARITCLIL